MLNFELETMRIWLKEQKDEGKEVIAYINELENDIEFLTCDSMQEAKEALIELKENNVPCGIVKGVRKMKHFLNLFEFYPNK